MVTSMRPPPRRFVSRMCASRRRLDTNTRQVVSVLCNARPLPPGPRGHAAPVHRGPVPAEDAARTARPPPAGHAPVRGRPPHWRHPVGRRQHPVWRLRAADRRHRRAAGAAGPGLRPAAVTAGTCGGRDQTAGQDHQNVDDGTTGQRTPPMVRVGRTPSGRIAPITHQPDRHTVQQGHAPSRIVDTCFYRFPSPKPIPTPTHTPTTPLLLARIYTRPFVLSVHHVLLGTDSVRLCFTHCRRVRYYRCVIFSDVVLQKNGTSRDNVTVFTGANDIRMFAALDKFNGRTHMQHWTTDGCNQMSGGSDGSLFPPRIQPDTVLHVFDKDMCRKLPLVWVYLSLIRRRAQKISTGKGVWTPCHVLACSAAYWGPCDFRGFTIPRVFRKIGGLSGDTRTRGPFTNVHCTRAFCGIAYIHHVSTSPNLSTTVYITAF